MLRLALPLIERREVAQGTMSFAFGLEGQAFPFKPGQYNTVTIPDPLYKTTKGTSGASRSLHRRAIRSS